MIRRINDDLNRFFISVFDNNIRVSHAIFPSLFIRPFVTNFLKIFVKFCKRLVSVKFGTSRYFG